MKGAWRLPIIIGVFAFVALLIAYQMDPTRDYPEVVIKTKLSPNETVAVNVPMAKREIADWVTYVVPLAKIYFLTDTDGLSLVNVAIGLVPNVMVGIDSTGTTYTIKNTLPIDKEVTITAIRAPAPNDQAKFKFYWYIGISAGNVLISLIFAGVVKRPIINIRRTGTQQSIIGKYCCCCFPCCREPKTPSQLRQEQEVRRLRDEERERLRLEKAEIKRRKIEEKVARKEARAASMV